MEEAIKSTNDEDLLAYMHAAGRRAVALEMATEFAMRHAERGSMMIALGVVEAGSGKKGSRVMRAARELFSKPDDALIQCDADAAFADAAFIPYDVMRGPIAENTSVITEWMRAGDIAKATAYFRLMGEESADDAWRVLLHAQQQLNPSGLVSEYMEALRGVHAMCRSAAAKARLMAAGVMFARGELRVKDDAKDANDLDMEKRMKALFTVTTSHRKKRAAPRVSSSDVKNINVDLSKTYCKPISLTVIKSSK
jgi:hypothetical protein